MADDLHRMEIAADIDNDSQPHQTRSARQLQRQCLSERDSAGHREVRLGSTTVSNVVIYTAVVSIENRRLELLPGMTANLRIETDAREGVSRVPNAALRWHPPGVTGADDHGQHVYVLMRQAAFGHPAHAFPGAGAAFRCAGWRESSRQQLQAAVLNRDDCGVDHNIRHRRRSKSGLC